MTQPFAPLVEMLWEADDPDVVLADRFGFRDSKAAGHWVNSTMVELWGIAVDSCDRIVMSDHNALAWITSGSGSYILKWSVAPERFARLSALSKLAHWLGEQGRSVSAPVATIDGRLHIELDRVSIGVQRQITGELLDVSNESQVRAAGAELAHLHLALAGYPFVSEFPGSTTERPELGARISAWLDSER